MPYALHIDVVPEGGGKIAVEHVFYGHTEAEARKIFETHADGCEFLGPAIDDDRTEEELLTITYEEWPSYVEDDAKEDESNDDDSATDEGDLGT